MDQLIDATGRVRLHTINRRSVEPASDPIVQRRQSTEEAAR